MAVEGYFSFMEIRPEGTTWHSCNTEKFDCLSLGQFNGIMRSQVEEPEADTKKEVL